MPSVMYQPKATTLACVLVRMVALVLILEYHSHNHPHFPTVEHKYKATSIYEYFTPYACSLSPKLILHSKVKITISIGTSHLWLHLILMHCQPPRWCKAISSQELHVLHLLCVFPFINPHGTFLSLPNT